MVSIFVSKAPFSKFIGNLWDIIDFLSFAYTISYKVVKNKFSFSIEANDDNDNNSTVTQYPSLRIPRVANCIVFILHK